VVVDLLVLVVYFAFVPVDYVDVRVVLVAEQSVVRLVILYALLVFFGPSVLEKVGEFLGLVDCCLFDFVHLLQNIFVFEFDFEQKHLVKELVVYQFLVGVKQGQKNRLVVVLRS
jgi:hypothetical protein